MVLTFETLPCLFDKTTVINTLDIDSSDKSNLEHIVFKILECKKLKKWYWYDTQKGYHILLHCPKNCDICRMCYDDPKRFAIDTGRPKAKQNVLFQPFSAHRCMKNERKTSMESLRKGV